MIKEAIEKIEELVKQNQDVKKIEMGNGKTLFILPNGKIEDDSRPLLPQAEFHSLSGIVDFAVNSSVSSFGGWEPDMFTINENLCVFLYAKSDSIYGKRPIIAAAFPMKGRKFNFDTFMDVESFVIGAQSCFVHTDQLAKMIDAVAGMQMNDGQTFKDDGVAQTVTIKRGVSLPTQKTVPNPITLKPYRTFTEIEQPESLFVLRVSDNGKTPVAGLFEADGGAWRLCAAERIAEALRKMLAEAGSDIAVRV